MIHERAQLVMRQLESFQISGQSLSYPHPINNNYQGMLMIEESTQKPSKPRRRRMHKSINLLAVPGPTSAPTLTHNNAQVLRKEILRTLLPAEDPPGLSTLRRVRLNSITKGKFPKDFFVSMGQGSQRNPMLPPLGQGTRMGHSGSAASIALPQSKTLGTSQVCLSPSSSFCSSNKSKPTAKLRPTSIKLAKLTIQTKSVATRLQILYPGTTKSLTTSKAQSAVTRFKSLSYSEPLKDADLEPTNDSLVGNSEFVPTSEIQSIHIKVECKGETKNKPNIMNTRGVRSVFLPSPCKRTATGMSSPAGPSLNPMSKTSSTAEESCLNRQSASTSGSSSQFSSRQTKAEAEEDSSIDLNNVTFGPKDINMC